MAANTIITDIGREKIAAAAASGRTITLKTFAVGDGEYIPTGQETDLRSEKYRQAIDSVSIDSKNKNILLFNNVLSETIGGFYICEYGIFDDENTLIAIGAIDKTYKPSPSDVKAVSISLTVRISIDNVDSVKFNIQLDGYASHQFVLQQDENVKAWVLQQEYVPKPNLTDKTLAGNFESLKIKDIDVVTKTDFFVNAQLTPTFTAGEEYIISPLDFNGTVQQTIVLDREYTDQSSVAYIGTDYVTFEINHNAAAGFGQINIQVLASTLSVDNYGFKAYVLEAPVAINNYTIPAGQVVYTLNIKKAIPSNNTINRISGSYLSASQSFIDNVRTLPILFEPVASGVLQLANSKEELKLSEDIFFLEKANTFSPKFKGEPEAPTRPTGEQSEFIANMQALWNQTLGIGIGLNGQAVKSFNSVTDLYNTVNGGCYFGHGAVMPDPGGYYHMTRIASNDTNGTGAFLATDNSKIYFGFANPTIYSWTQLSTVEQLQNGTFAATLLSLVAQFATLGTAGVATGSLAIYGNQPTNPVNFVFAGNGSAGAGAYINANYDNANQVAFINFPYKLSDGITLARPCLGNSNAASDQIAKLADITANGGGIVASGGSDGAMWVLFANGLILQTAAVQVALVPNGTAGGSIALPKSITNRTTYNIQSSFGAGALVNGRISADIPGTSIITYSVYNNNANTGNQIIEFFVWSY